jgi:hypothetical protein
MEQHVADLRAIFQRLVDNSLAINLEKCEFVVEELDFLWHRLQVKYDFSRPHTIKDLQRFLGMANFYRQFCQKLHRFLPL